MLPHCSQTSLPVNFSSLSFMPRLWIQSSTLLSPFLSQQHKTHPASLTRQTNFPTHSLCHKYYSIWHAHPTDFLDMCLAVSLPFPPGNHCRSWHNPKAPLRSTKPKIKSEALCQADIAFSAGHKHCSEHRGYKIEECLAGFQFFSISVYSKVLRYISLASLA